MLINEHESSMNASAGLLVSRQGFSYSAVDATAVSYLSRNMTSFGDILGEERFMRLCTLPFEKSP